MNGLVKLVLNKTHNKSLLPTPLTTLAIAPGVKGSLTSLGAAEFNRYVSGEFMRRTLTKALLLAPAIATASPVTYECDYGTYSDMEGSHKVTKEFVLTFIVDEENKKSYIVGNNGSEEVAAIPHIYGGISFVEMTGSGNVMTTAIDTKGNSVHSRNTSLGGELVPSQYYGKCKTK